MIDKCCDWVHVPTPSVSQQRLMEDQPASLQEAKRHGSAQGFLNSARIQHPLATCKKSGESGGPRLQWRQSPISGHVEVTRNGGSLKWMVSWENPIKILKLMICGYPHFRKLPCVWIVMSWPWNFGYPITPLFCCKTCTWHPSKGHR